MSKRWWLSIVMTCFFPAVCVKNWEVWRVRRTVQLVDRTLDAVKEPLDCNQLISEVAKLLEFELRNSGWRLLLKLAPGLLLPPGAKKRLGQ